ARLEALAGFQPLDGTPNFFTQSTRADHGGDHHHRQRQHNGLVDSGHDGRYGHGQLYLVQLLAFGGAKGVGGFNQVGGDLSDTQNGQADGGGRGEYHGRHTGGHRTEAKERNRWYQI